MEEFNKWADWANSKKFLMSCATVILSVLIISVCSCTAVSCTAISKTDESRYKYRAMESEAFWKNANQK